MSSPTGGAKVHSTASRIGTIVLGLIFIATTGTLGALLGGVFVRFFMPRAPDGWTGIARGLGGLMTGGLIAVVIAAFLVVPLARRGTRALALSAAVATSLAALLFLVLYLARPQPSNTGAIGGLRQVDDFLPSRGTPLKRLAVADRCCSDVASKVES